MREVSQSMAEIAALTRFDRRPNAHLTTDRKPHFRQLRLAESREGDTSIDGDRRVERWILSRDRRPDPKNGLDATDRLP
jgi:hypothetical protein